MATQRELAERWPQVPRALLDTSVLYPTWSRIVLQKLASAGLFGAIWSEWIIAETWRTLTIKCIESGLTHEQISGSSNRMLARLLPVVRLVPLRDYTGPPPWPQLTDSFDEPVWAAACIGRANYVVSNNTNDFPPVAHPSSTVQHIFEGIEYVTAIEFIEEVLGQNAAEWLGRDIPAGAPRSGRRTS